MSDRASSPHPSPDGADAPSTPSTPSGRRPVTSRSPRRVGLRVFLVTWALVALGVLVAAREVLLPFVLALVVAYVFTPVVARLEAARVPRWAAILLAYGVSLSVLFGGAALVAPRMIGEVNHLRAEAPHLVERAKNEWAPWLEARLAHLRPAAPPAPPPDHHAHEHATSAVRLVPLPDGAYDVYVARGIEIRPGPDGVLRVEQSEPRHAGRHEPSLFTRVTGQAVEFGRANSLELLRLGQQIVASVSRGIFVFFITLMLAAYLMLTRERVLGFFRDLFLPHQRDSFEEFLARVDRGLSGVVRGQLLICLVNGVLSAIGFWLFGLKYWFVLAVVAGAMSIIPIFGAILSSVPAVAIGLSQSFGTAVAVLAWIVGIHQIEANFLNPKIIGDAARIHPVLVVFSLVVGEHLFKLPGALLAVPVLSILQSLFLHFQAIVYRAEPADGPDPDAP